VFPSLYLLISAILRSPKNTSNGTAQERYWVRTKFSFINSPDGEIVALEGRAVCPRAKIYNAICEAHEELEHKGRDKTFNLVKSRFSFIPKGAFLFPSPRIL
jgi:hypothetical protein